MTKKLEFVFRKYSPNEHIQGIWNKSGFLLFYVRDITEVFPYCSKSMIYLDELCF